MEYILRKLELNDYDKFLILINDFRKTNFTKEKYEELFKYITNMGDIWVIEYDNNLIGTGTIIYEYKFIFNCTILAHIEDVCIKEEFRKNGFGKILMNKLVEEAKKKGSYKITLDCMNENINFYEKCNFEKRGTQMTILIYDPNLKA